MALALVPRDLPGLSRLKGRGFNARGRRAVPALDIAKTYYGADRILSGSALPGPYTGKGVVVGFCDSGFDPNHIAFRGADGRSACDGLSITMNPPVSARLWILLMR